MIIALVGPDTYRSLTQLNKIVADYSAKYPQATIERFDALEDETTKILAALGSRSLFSIKKLVIVRNAVDELPLDQQQLIAQRCEKLDPEITVLFWESKLLPKKGKLAPLLLQQKYTRTFPLLSGAELQRTVATIIKEQEVDVESAALAVLLQRCGSDLWLLDREIHKLRAYRAGKVIRRQDVEAMTRPFLENEIFATIDAIARGDRSEALRRLHGHLQSGEDPQYLVSMINYQFRTLAIVRKGIDDGRSQAQIASEAKLNPYVVRKATQLVGSYSFVQLQRIYQKITNLIVSLRSGEVAPELALDLLIVGLTRP